LVARYSRYCSVSFIVSYFFVQFADLVSVFISIKELEGTAVSVLSQSLLGFVFKLPLVKSLDYFEGSSSISSDEEQKLAAAAANNTAYIYNPNLFEVLYFSKYAFVLGAAYSVKLSLDWHQRNVLLNQLGTREPIDTGFTPVQLALAKRSRKLRELEQNANLTVEERSQLMYAERVRDLEWYLGVDTPPQTPDGTDPNANNEKKGTGKMGAADVGGASTTDGSDKTKPSAKGAAEGGADGSGGMQEQQASGTLQLVKVKNAMGKDVEVVRKPANETATPWNLFNSIPDKYVFRIPDSRFRIRNSGYLSTKQKVPSKPGMYDVMGADVVRGKNGKVQHIIHNFDISSIPEWPGDVKWTKDWGVPEILICCTEIPIETGGMWGVPESDCGFTFITYFMLNEESRRVLKSGQLSPHLKLWKRTCAYGRSIRKGCSFKFIAQCENMQDMPVNSTIKSYNGKPVLLCDNARFLHDQMPRILEVDFDIREWNFLVRQYMPKVRGLMEKAHAELCFLVEGKNDAELPECTLGTGRMDYLKPFQQPEVDMDTCSLLLPKGEREKNAALVKESIEKKQRNIVNGPKELGWMVENKK